MNTITKVLLPALALLANASMAEDEVIDLSERTTPTCELIGLVARPPEGWFSVPMEDTPPGLAGCQMMRTGENEELVGIIRLSSGDTGGRAPGEESHNRQIAIEIEILKAMGIRLHVAEPLWSRHDVPISDLRDAGFSETGQAIGLAAEIEGSGLPQEVHFLTFHGPATQYALVLITPPRETEPEIYRRNIDDFARVIQTLDVP